MYSGQSLLEQKRLQWAREREEMMGLCGLWGGMDKLPKPEPRRNSLLPPIQAKQEDPRAEESETSGYISDSPQHDPSTDQNYWADSKAEKNFRNESRLRTSPDSVLSTPEDRLKWGDRGVGVGHLWEPVVEAPDTRLPQVFESYRATPRWLERGLKLADGNKADILFIQHDDEEPTKFLLGQNVPLPPEVLEERERKRQKALEHQTAIRKQLEERERKRKEEKENRLREERMEEERILREQDLERRRRDEELCKSKMRQRKEEMQEDAMREAIKAAELRAVEEKKKFKKIELDRVNDSMKPRKLEKLRDSASQVETHTMMDSSSQSENIFDTGLALVLDGVSDAVPLALLMSQAADTRGLRVVSDAATQTGRKFGSGGRSRRSQRQPSRASGRSDSSEKSTSLERRSTRHAHCTASSKLRSRSQPRLSLGERPKWGINRPTVQYLKQSEKDPHYLRRMKRRARRTKEAGTGVTEKLLQSDMRLLSFQTDEDEERKKSPFLLENAFSMPSFETDENEARKKSPFILESVFRMPSLETNENEERKNSPFILENGFRMLSNPSSPRFVPICSNNLHEEVEEMFQVIVDGKDSDEEKGMKVEDIDDESQVCPEPEEIDSPPSTGRSEDKSNDGYADNDDSEEGETTDLVKEVQKEAIIQIEALKIVMALKFDDFLSKKKEPAQVLDLSRTKILTKEDYKKYFDRVPEYKIKPEKVLPETIKIRDKDFNLTPSRKECRVPEYTYLDPTPPDMKGVHLADLCPVSIDWKMLTTLRPKTKQEEDMFSRLVQLGKLDLKHQQTLKRSKIADWVRRTKNPRSSIVETRVLSCKECGEDFCDGTVITNSTEF